MNLKNKTTAQIIEDELEQNQANEAAKEWWNQVKKIKAKDVGIMHWVAIRQSAFDANEIVSAKESEHTDYVEATIKAIKSRYPKISPSGMSEQISSVIPIQVVDNYEGIFGIFFKLFLKKFYGRYSWFCLSQACAVSIVQDVALKDPNADCYCVIAKRSEVTINKLQKSLSNFYNYQANGFIKPDEIL